MQAHNGYAFSRFLNGHSTKHTVYSMQLHLGVWPIDGMKVLQI